MANHYDKSSLPKTLDEYDKELNSIDIRLTSIGMTMENMLSVMEKDLTGHTTSAVPTSSVDTSGFDMSYIDKAESILNLVNNLRNKS